MNRAAPVWRVVAEREVSTRLRDKTFIGSTVFMLLLLVGVLVVSAVVEGGQERYDVAAVGVDGADLVTAADGVLAGAGSGVDAVVVDDAAEAEQRVRDGSADAALVPTGDGWSVVGEDDVPGQLSAALAAAVASAELRANAAEQGVDLGALQQGTAVEERLLDPDAEQAGPRAGVAFAFALVFLVTALSFGMGIAQSVVQEKQSRVVEILAAAVPVRSMLWGKILGNTLLALGQVALLSVVGVVGLVVGGQRDLLDGVGAAVAWYVVLFVLGFLALASLWSVAGSLASRVEDLQSTTLPGQALLFVPYFVSAFAGEEARTVASMLPIVSTMVLPGRMAEGAVPWWQVAVAVVGTVLAAVVFVRLGARLYERTLLRTGGKLTYREAFRATAD